MAGAEVAQQPSAQADAIRQNCRADYQSLCASVPPGGQASLNCLAQHARQLSPREELMLMRGACGYDLRRMCAGTPLGVGNAVRCLANHSQSLSPGCEQVLMMMHARR